MNTEKTHTWFSNRQFIAMIRSMLDEAGHRDIAISRQWIDEDTPGERYLIHVPVGSTLTIALAPRNGFFEAKNVEDLKRHAREFALALTNLNRAEKMLERYVRDVRKAAVVEIDGARAKGLDIVLDGVGLKTTLAHGLTGKNWKDAALHVLASVRVRHTSFYLRPKVTVLWVEEPTDIADELARILVEQRERQERISELDALGADLTLDPITLELLEMHGLNAEEVLCEVVKKQCVNLTVEHLGRERSLSLTSYAGEVTASIDLDGAFWNGQHLWLTGDRATGHKGLVGKSLGDLVRHPVFTSRPIVAVEDRHIDHFVFDLSDKIMFDADTGRVWREERLAA